MQVLRTQRISRMARRTQDRSIFGWLGRTSCGKLVWSKTYGGQGGEQVEGLVVLPDGGFAVAGNTNSPDLPGSPKYSGGGSDFWLLRTDASGNLLWSKTFGGAGYDAPNAIVSRKGGGFAAVGGSESSDLPDAQKTSGGRDFWLVATDAGGVPLWNKTYGGSGDDEALAIAELSDGGFALMRQDPIHGSSRRAKKSGSRRYVAGAH